MCEREVLEWPMDGKRNAPDDLSQEGRGSSSTKAHTTKNGGPSGMHGVHEFGKNLGKEKRQTGKRRARKVKI